MSQPRNIVLIGATGSIGQSTLQVLRQHPDDLNLVGIAAGSNRSHIDQIAHEFNIPRSATTVFAESGVEGLIDLATLPQADIVLIAATGTVGILPTLAALDAGKDIALASKEVLVAAGKFVMAAVQKTGRRIIPVDSEHNAIFQCLEGNQNPNHLRRIILTASGGPFRNTPLDALESVTLEQALKHPNWDMGPKVTIDSSTMANKGLEMIEARWLFGVNPSQIDVVIHPQSLVHSMVEFCDGSIIAQLSPPSMTFAIQHALLHPKRAPGVRDTIDFTQLQELSFNPPDEVRFPALRLAREAMIAGGLAPAAFNTANECAVDAFIAKRIPFLAIPQFISQVLNQLDNREPNSIDELLAAESQIRLQANALLIR